MAERSPRRRWRGVLRDPVVAVAAGWLVAVGAVAILSRVWTPYPPNKQFTGPPLTGPSRDNLLGTDDVGRDILSRLMDGAAVSLRVSLSVVIVALIVAVPIGLLSGYRGGWADTAVMRVLDAFTSIPGLVAALAIVGVLGPGINNVIIALIIVAVPPFVRLVRAQALAVATEPYVDVSKVVGSSITTILFRRILPGVVPALTVQVSLTLGTVLTAEAALSFLGLGVIPPDPSWGSVLQRSYANMLRNPAGVFAPILTIAITVLAFNIIGDGLRDAMASTARRTRRARLGATTVDPAVSRAAPDPAAARDPSLALDVHELSIAFDTARSSVEAVTGVSLSVRRGEIHAIVGESGAGKSALSMSVARLLLSPPARITGGRVDFAGVDMLRLDLGQLRKVRGGGIGLIFQNPMTSLDPSFTIGNSLVEAITNHRDVSTREAAAIAEQLLADVGIGSPRRRLRQLPHELSGGMRQRVMIAMALAGGPDVLIADEPTTALDVTIQAQILELLRDQRDTGGTSIVIVTHDLGVVAEVADRVTVMYAGEVVETAPAEQLFASPRHPYTAALLKAVPDPHERPDRLATIPGTVPSPDRREPGCRFRPRCAHATDACATEQQLRPIDDEVAVRCVRSEELAGTVAEVSG